MGTRGIPNRGPRDRKGFLKTRPWSTDPGLVGAAGDAVGIANASASAEIVDNGDLIGIAIATATGDLAASGSASGTAIAAASIEDDVENGSAIGVAAAAESGAIVVAQAAAGGSASASAAGLLDPAGDIVGIAIATATTEEDVEQGSAIGKGDAGAFVILVSSTLAIGESIAAANPMGASTTGEADAGASPTILSKADSGGSSAGSAMAFQADPIVPTARLSYDAFEIAQPKRVAAPPAKAPARPTPILAAGSAIGTAHARAEGILVFPTVADVVASAPAWDDNVDDVMELMFVADLVAA